MIYLDASVVCSLHMRDANTPMALQLIRTAAEPLAISALVEVEAANAFSLRVFRQEWTHVNMVNAERDLAVDIQNGLLLPVPLPEAAFARAKSLARNLTPAIGVRSGDLLHVAAAIELGASALYTFDQRQRKAAKAAGLKVNPLP
jgi:predicted nucleic acid-binding protein